MEESRAALAEFCFRGQRLAVVSLMPDFTPQAVLVVFLRGRREAENYEKNGSKQGQVEEIRAVLAKFCARQLPPASASFRQLPWASASAYIPQFKQP